MTEHDGRSLELRLVDLGHSIEYPPTPDLSASVRQAIETGDESRRGTPAPWWRQRTFAYAALSLFVVLSAVLIAVPGARHAVADWLGVPGIRIGFDEGTGEAPPLGEDLNLGTPVTLDEAQSGLDFAPAIPDELGAPDGVYLADDVTGGRLSLVYRAGPALPETETTSAGALLVQFRGEADPEFFKKLFASDTDIREAQVGGIHGGFGYWISGGPHVLLYRDADGAMIQETARLAGNTLIWDSGDVTFRLETALGMRDALQIADSLR